MKKITVIILIISLSCGISRASAQKDSLVIVPELSSKNLEHIIKTSINEGRMDIAFQVALMNGRSLDFKEILTALKKTIFPLDSISKYLNRNIDSKEAVKLQKIYIKNGELENSEKASSISGVILKERNYINIHSICIKRNEIDKGILAAKKAGGKGRKKLGLLLREYTKSKKMTKSIKVATAIGGENLSKREWEEIEKIIPPGNREEIVKFIMKGD